MAISKIVKYVNEEGFTFQFEPIEDTLKVKAVNIAKHKSKYIIGYEARYLIQDTNPTSPEDNGDNNLFLVGYHSDFTVDRGQRQLITIFKEEDFKKDNGYNGKVYADGFGWKSYPGAKKQGLINKQVRRGRYLVGINEGLAQNIARGGKFEDNSIDIEAKEYLKNYYIFGLSAYIHSGITLHLGFRTKTGGYMDWDTSNIGLCFASKKEFKTRKQAEKAVRGLIQEWNMYLSGDVYCLVKETYSKEKEQIDHDTVGGYYGYDEALKALETEI